MNLGLRLGLFALVASSQSACFLIPEDAVDAVKDQIPQVQHTLRIDALADGSGSTHLTVCVSDPTVCVQTDGPFAASMANGEPVDLPFVVDYKEADGKEIGRFQGDVMGDAPESEITVTRGADPDTASVVTLPEPAMITAPAEGASFSVSMDFVQVTWDSKMGTDPMEWSATVKCGAAAATTVMPTKIEDTGSTVIDPAKFNIKPGDTCDVTLHLSRWRDGTIEKAFVGNGLITAKQTRSVKVIVTP